MQACCMVERMHDLRPVFEVHWGREWELMDLCFMTCFTGTLPLWVTLAHLWFILQILILFIQSWQPCIIHPSILDLYLYWFFFFCLCLDVCLYFSSSASLYVSFFSLSPLSVSLLFSSWLQRCSPCTSWRCSGCLNRAAVVLACLPSPHCCAILERSCCLSSVFQLKRSVYQFYM